MTQYLHVFGSEYLYTIRKFDSAAFRVFAFIVADLIEKDNGSPDIYLGGSKLFEIHDYFHYEIETIRNAITLLTKVKVLAKQGNGNYKVNESVIKIIQNPLWQKES